MLTTLVHGYWSTGNVIEMTENEVQKYPSPRRKGINLFESPLRSIRHWVFSLVVKHTIHLWTHQFEGHLKPSDVVGIWISTVIDPCPWHFVFHDNATLAQISLGDVRLQGRSVRMPVGREKFNLPAFDQKRFFQNFRLRPGHHMWPMRWNDETRGMCALPINTTLYQWMDPISRGTYKYIGTYRYPCALHTVSTYS